MEKAVVRRGIGAVVLALVAALLLGYLLKDKGPERKKVVNMELPNSRIQIFPESGTQTLDTAGGAVSGAATSATNSATKATAGGAAVTGLDKKPFTGVNLLVDEKTGNPSLDNKRVTVDRSGQPIVSGTKNKAKDASVNFAFRSSQKAVRPSVDRSVLKKKRSSTGSSKAKLVGEKKLAPVGARNRSSRKIASSRNKSKSSVASSTAAAPAGRNKYVVQLLATSNISKANDLKDTMKKEGYRAFVSKINRAGKPLYRVRVGSYKGRSVALKKQASMKRRYTKNTYVQDSMVVKN